MRPKEERQALGLRTDEQVSSPSTSGSLPSQGGDAVEKEGEAAQGESGPTASVPLNPTSESQPERGEAPPAGEDSKDMPDHLPFQVRLPGFDGGLEV